MSYIKGTFGRQESRPKQILHPKHTCFSNEKLGGSKRAQGEALAVEGFVGEGELVGGGGGRHAVDAVHLALAGHINI